MPKAYWIAQVEVTEPEAYEQYRARNGEAFAKYNARFLVRGNPQEQIEGQSRPRTVVLEFPDLATAQACYHSPEYQAAKAFRDGAGIVDLVIVEGMPD